MYTQLRYIGLYHIEYEIFHKGEYGQKGDKRGPRRKPTPEEIERWNQEKRVKKYRRIIQANFIPGDYYVTLKFPKGYRPPIEEVEKTYKSFRTYMKREYTKQGLPMKYLYRMEIGKRGGIHLHCIMNALENGLEIMNRCWRKARGVTEIEDMIAEDSTQITDMVVMDGKVDTELLYAEGGYQDLADYMCKKLPDTDVSPEDKKKLLKISGSRNLVRPEPERKKYTHRTLKRMIEAGPEKINSDPHLRRRYCSPGHIIDKNTWYVGTNPVTGMSYLYYTELRVKRRNE